MNESTDVVVIGAGLAGLAAAAALGRAGRAVTVVEKASALGGRAATHRRDGFSLNLGAHALFVAGAGIRVLRELGVTPRGKVPSTSGAHAFDGGQLHTLPAGFVSLVTTGLLPLSAKLELGKLLAGLQSIDANAEQGLAVEAWIDRTLESPAARAFAGALVRVSTYGADFARLDAGAAIEQLQRALKSGVLYLDGGWQTLVDGLRAVAVDAGARVLTGAKAERVDVEGGAVRGVILADGRRIDTSSAILAGSPAAASALVPGDAHLARCAERAVPVKAASLDVTLRRLPNPRSTFALGIDRPLYLSVHSATAELAPPGGAVIHVMEYLAPGREADEAELEALLELVQPGFRDAIVQRRFLPSLTVSNALPTAEDRGLAGRPDVIVPGVDGLFVAGDWVGREGLLADASLASGRAAADRVSERRPFARDAA